ncbi:V-type ATP synthase subunit D [Desulfoferrobacter suflitae]|uniref:V-type ATP synthase subunit D n=1 Tax=Desulfoferrobacter suflitae TaxID=2865782 RepID=UPI0021640C34|nr:V-type ATP synthase subunit D [Desulfoferrobacter suflitae]MCK8604121.1 V-type ATP synthase subunit D [Desulfoferrobacter suflitae]
MAGKTKKTRPELLKRRRLLAAYERFLPTLILKKQQIQMEILKVRTAAAQSRTEITRRITANDSWLPLFSESLPGLVTRLVSVDRVELGERNVAGIALPTVITVHFILKPYSLFATPPWVDQGLALIKELLELRETIRVLREQERLLQKELRKVTQRVNLFEKVMIPRTRESIRIIRIQLAEEETAAVGRAKIAKGKSADQSRSVQEVSA